ncbi:MAG: hypothetical protein K0R51_1069 [Cytophagaceae bacterium]|jgi:acetyl esterase/lipase|nr:hypothetical protein [Cytophagaceae bacterium]
MNDDNIEFYNIQAPSFKSLLFKRAFQWSGLKKIMERFSAPGPLLYLINAPYPTRSLKTVANVQRHTQNGKNVFTLSSKVKTSAIVVLYLHGGAFTINFTRPHWRFIRDLIHRNHCTVVAPDFPLLPFDYQTRLEMVYHVYQSLLLKTESKNIIFMGDSSGGNMALALAQLAHERKINAPGQVIMLSPWLDVSMSNPELKTNLPYDPMLSYPAAIKVGKVHAGIAGPTFYQVSPLYGQLKDIGRISIFTGTHDILYPDAKKLKALANAQQVPFNYFEYRSMMHTWMLFDMPESQMVKEQIASLIAS